MLYPGHEGGSIEEANQQFAAALRGGNDTGYVRQLMFYAYSNASGMEYDLQLVRLASEMRKNHEQLGLEERNRILSEVYYGYKDKTTEMISKVLGPDEHLETFVYLSKGIDLDAKPYLKEALSKLKKQAGG